MGRWKYFIEMNYLPDNDASKAIQVPDTSIRRLFIDHNFAESNMPTMYCTLNIDKALFDQMIVGAKTDTVILTVYKANKSTTAEAKEIVYNSVCEYFLAHDINYNNDIDYSSPEDKVDQRKDVYREVNIGLMFKDCIERNKQTNNKTVQDSTMMNIVGSLFSGQPALIEAFTYNDKFDQLIIPPQETLSKTIAFLNETKVFFDTQYRLFFEPDCAYLISSSGKAVARKDDKFDTVRFIIHNPYDRRAAALGMQEDSRSKSYVVQVNALDTRYNIDANMAKKFAAVEAIINPGRSECLSALSSMQKVMNDINQIGGGIQTVVKDNLKALQEIPSVMSKMKITFNQIDLDSNGESSKAISAMDVISRAISSMPEKDKTTKESDGSETTTKGLDKEKKQEILDTIKLDKETVRAKVKEYKKIHNDYKHNMNTANDIAGKIVGLPGCFGGVSPSNAKNNINLAKNTLKFIKEGSDNMAAECVKNLMPYADSMNAVSAACKSVLSMVELSGIEPDKVKDPVKDLNDCITSFNGFASTTSINIATQQGFPLQFKNMKADFEPYVQKMSNVAINLKAQVDTLKQDIQTVGEQAKSALRAIQNAGNDAANILKSNNLTLSSLKDLKNDINAVKDISQIGKLGVSKLNFKLNFGRGSKGTGAAIYKIKNDNPNKLKNIKFEMENKLNTFMLNKNDLDVSVFNINKRYIIKNFDAHNDKDGSFLLDRKIELFMREGEEFICNCQMQFRLILNDATDSRSDIEKVVDDILSGTGDKKENIAKLAGEIADSMDSDIMKHLGGNKNLRTLAYLAKNFEGVDTKGKGRKEVVKELYKKNKDVVKDAKKAGDQADKK